MNPTYLDCNATSPLEPAVRELMFEWYSRTGNAGSRTHDYGAEAKRAVVNARKQVAAVVDAEPKPCSGGLNDGRVHRVGAGPPPPRL